MGRQKIEGKVSDTAAKLESNQSEAIQKGFAFVVANNFKLVYDTIEELQDATDRLFSGLKIIHSIYAAKAQKIIEE